MVFLVSFFLRIISIAPCYHSELVGDTFNWRGLWSEQNRLDCSGVAMQPVLTFPGRPAYSTNPASPAAHTGRLFFWLPSNTSTVPHPFFTQRWPTRKHVIISRYFDTHHVRLNLSNWLPEYFLWNACWNKGVILSSVSCRSDENWISESIWCTYQDATVSHIWSALLLVFFGLASLASQGCYITTWFCW